jgi:tyrosyl-tRNA synthetase
VAAALNKLLAPIQEAYHASPEWQEIALKAYPLPPKEEEKSQKCGDTISPIKERKHQEFRLRRKPLEWCD